MKKAFRQMHSKMQEAQANQPGYNPQPDPSKPASKAPGEDYIDFEEIK